jgi:hypothetical protein
MIYTLPLEIIRMILRNLASSTHLLCVSSIVCRDWADLSQRPLLALVMLDTHQRLVQVLDRMDQLKPWLDKCTTRLTLAVGMKVHQNCINDRFLYVRWLTAMEGSMIGMRRAKSMYTRSLVILVAAFRHLQEIFLDGISFDGELVDEPHVSRKLSVRKLIIRRDPPDLGPLSGLTKELAFPHFEAVHLVLCYPLYLQSSELQTYLQAYQSLQRLHVELRSARHLAGPIAIFRGGSRLTLLGLRTFDQPALDNICLRSNCKVLILNPPSHTIPGSRDVSCALHLAGGRWAQDPRKGLPRTRLPLMACRLVHPATAHHISPNMSVTLKFEDLLVT